MDIRTYPGKVFVVEDDLSYIRDENLQPLRYKAGDQIPPGLHVGDKKLIPVGTKINVTDVRAPHYRSVYVFASPANNSAGSFGWTLAKNLAGGFMGEVTGFAPAKYEKEPEGNNKTCFDAEALIRSGPPNFTLTGNKIPQGSFVMVTDTSSDGSTVKVSKLEIVNGQMVVGDEIGWTRLRNLADGCSSDQFLTAEWFAKEGPNGCWKDDNYLFPKVMVNIIGIDSDLEQVTFDSFAPYLKLVKSAAEANLQILINSAFRTYARQAELYAQSHNGGPPANRPGNSDHQHGQAFDLNTRQNASLYAWLKQNGPRHGFIRTVPRERWHWEYRPKQAAQMPPGVFSVPPNIEDLD